MDRKVHVLVLPSWYPSREIPNNGIFFKEQAQAISREGARVGVVYVDIKGLHMFNMKNLIKYHFQKNFSLEDGIPTIRFMGWNLFPRMQKLQAKYWVKKTLYLVDNYIRKYGKPDVIHAHSVLWGGYAAMLASQRHNIPYIITEHSTSYARGLIEDWQKPYIKETFNNASEIIAVSSPFSKLLSKYLDNNEKEIKIVFNLVDTKFFSLPKGSRKKTPFTFLTVAFLTPKKGIDILIRAFKQAFKNNDNVLLQIGGDGEQRQELEGLVKELNIEDKVTFLGGLSREQVRNAMWNANVFVLPSYFETFGVVLIEALSTGLPVVATKCGGPEDIVAPGTGILVNPGNISELASALKKIYSNYINYHEQDLKNYVEMNFSNSAIAKKIINIYNEVISQL